MFYGKSSLQYYNRSYSSQSPTKSFACPVSYDLPPFSISCEPPILSTSVLLRYNAIDDSVVKEDKGERKTVRPTLESARNTPRVSERQQELQSTIAGYRPHISQVIRLHHHWISRIRQVIDIRSSATRLTAPATPFTGFTKPAIT